MNRARNGAKILIVDDEPLNVKLLKAILEGHPYTLTCAYNGAEALEKVREETPDLVLLDIMMPGMNGYEVTQRMKSDPRTKHIPIILITALESADNKIKGLEAGADEFLNKPISKAELLARVNSLLKLKQYEEQLKARLQSQGMVVATDAKESSRAKESQLPSVLVVEDDERDAKLILMYLQGMPYKVTLVQSGEDAVSFARQQEVDLILLDLLLPGMDGFGVLHRLKEREETRNIQVVAVTCLTDLETKIRGIETGVDDYLVKPINMHELRVRINALIKKKAYLDHLKKGYQVAVHSAVTDKLTGLYNYAYFHHFLGIEIKRSKRQNHSVALMVIDFDDFKRINDTFGHPAGDEVLRSFGKLFRENIREIDLGVRYGGEEFAAVLPYADRTTALAAGQRLKSIVEKHTFLLEGNGASARVTLSIGIAVYPADADCPEDLIQRADNALYRAKKGKNRVCMYE